MQVGRFGNCRVGGSMRVLWPEPRTARKVLERFTLRVGGLLWFRWRLTLRIRSADSGTDGREPFAYLLANQRDAALTILLSNVRGTTEELGAGSIRQRRARSFVRWGWCWRLGPHALKRRLFHRCRGSRGLSLHSRPIYSRLNSLELEPSILNFTKDIKGSRRDPSMGRTCGHLVPVSNHACRLLRCRIIGTL